MPDGLRFFDFPRLDENDVWGDMLYKKQDKPDHWVVIPLRTKAVEILKDGFEKEIPVPLFLRRRPLVAAFKE